MNVMKHIYKVWYEDSDDGTELEIVIIANNMSDIERRYEHLRKVEILNAAFDISEESKEG